MTIKCGCTFGSSTTFIFFVCFPHCQTCSLAININLDLDLSTEMSGLVSQHHKTTSFLTLMQWLTHFYSFLNAFYPLFTQTLNNGSYFMFQSNIANAQQQQAHFSLIINSNSKSFKYTKHKLTTVRAPVRKGGLSA